VEAAWLYQADQVCPEDLPMTAAQALAMRSFHLELAGRVSGVGGRLTRSCWSRT
jgi:hypothetical protein